MNYRLSKINCVIWLQGEPSFHLFGFIMCVSATAARALKSVLQDILLSSDGYGSLFLAIAILS